MRVAVQQGGDVPAARSACATLSGLTSVMVFSSAAVCALLPSRAAPASAWRDSH